MPFANTNETDFASMAGEIQKIGERDKLKKIYANILSELSALPSSEARYGLLLMCMGAEVVVIQNKKKGLETAVMRRRFYSGLGASLVEFFRKNLVHKGTGYNPLADMPEGVETAKAV